MSGMEPLIRQAARVIVLDPERRVLLVLHNLKDEGLMLWVAPGGGLEPGENPEEAARRELREELGLSSVVLGPCIWVRDHTFQFKGRPCRQTERFYVCEVPAFELPAEVSEELRQEQLVERRWWTRDELRAAGTTLFAPRRLPELLERLHTEGPPAEPFDTQG